MIKRFFDILVATMLLLVFSPLILFGAMIVWAYMGRPVFFRQVRPGYKGHPFLLYKFRTMRDAVDASGNPLPDSERLTLAGKILRSSSLDELPQLLNVLKGDMSLVGPRPLLMEYLPLYSSEQMRRHDVRPGITGWAQVHGRNTIGWEERFQRDVWYVDHQSFLLDLKILILTVRKVIIRDGINKAGEATMSKFAGNGKS